MVQDPAKNKIPLFQMSLRGTFLLMTVAAYWIWLLADLEWAWQLGLASVAVISGTLAHYIYARLLHWRGTGLISNIVVGYFGFVIVLAIAGKWPPLSWQRNIISDALSLLLLTGEAGAPAVTGWLIFASIALCSAAHTIKPSYTTALISALGVNMWWGVAIMIARDAG